MAWGTGLNTLVGGASDGGDDLIGHTITTIDQTVFRVYRMGFQ